MKKGIILDVDGTLWDGTRAITDSWNAFREQYIPELPEPFSEPQMQSVLGKTMTEIGDIILGTLPGDRRYDVMERLLQYEVDYMWEHGGTVYPGARECFLKLREMGFSLYIVSNCQKGYIEDFLHAAGAEDLIEDHLCYEDTHEEKGYNIKLCVDRNKLDYAVYVGDTAGDLQASRAAGIDFIYASYGFGDVTGMEGVTAQISSFTQLPETAALLTGKD